MASVWGALGQVNPPATTLTTGYTVPALKRGAVTVIATNTGAGAATIRIAHSPAAAPIDVKHYIVYDFSLAVGASNSTAKFATNAGDIIRVYSSTADVAFNVNGIEEDT